MNLADRRPRVNQASGSAPYGRHTCTPCLWNIDRSYYFMAVNEGAIRVTPLGASLDTAGEVFDLYKVHQGNRLLKTHGRADGARRPARGGRDSRVCHRLPALRVN
ncbi:MAG: hypothetical protein ACYC3X_14870 [Pirellulaceae bacterium]